MLTKWRYSAFQRTTLEHLLRARKRDQLIICGVFAHIGCMTTAVDAFMRDVEPFMVADGVADFSREKHDLALTYVAERCGVVTTTARLLRRALMATLTLETMRADVAEMLEEDRVGDRRRRQSRRLRSRLDAPDGAGDAMAQRRRRTSSSPTSQSGRS